MGEITKKVTRNCNLVEDTLRSTKREGVEDLLKYLRESSYYFDPASSFYHSNFPGGLVDHMLKVRDTMMKLNDTLEVGLKQENIDIVSLLHDLAKVGSYKTESKNIKEDLPGGRFEWHAYKSYGINYEQEEEQVLPHGMQAVMLASRYIKLEECEIAAIVHHMGCYEGMDQIRSLNKARVKFPLAQILSMADEWSSAQLETTYSLKEIPWED